MRGAGPRRSRRPAAPGRSAAGHSRGKGLVIDITEFGIAADQRGKVRLLLPLGPAAFAQLAGKVAFQLCGRGGVTGNVSQRHVAQLGGIQRAITPLALLTLLFIGAHHKYRTDILPYSCHTSYQMGKFLFRPKTIPAGFRTWGCANPRQTGGRFMRVADAS